MPPPTNPNATSVSPDALYRSRLADLNAEHTAALAIARRLRLSLLATGLLAALVTLLALRGLLPLRVLLLPLLAALVLLPFLLRLRARLERLDRLLTHNRRALDRSTGDKPQSGHTGEDLPVAAHLPRHLYARDLQILGPDSLFGLLATARTRIGREALADLLLNLPGEPDEIRNRQLAVQELAPQTGLREQIALLGKDARDEVPSSELHAWLAQPAISLPRYTRPLLGVTSAILVLLLVAGLAHLAPWSVVRPNLLAVLALQVAIALRVRSQVRPVLEAARRLPRQTALLTESIALMDRTPATAAALQELRSRIHDAAPALSRLNRTLALLDQRNNQYFFLPSLLLALGTHGAAALSRWRTEHAVDLRRWLSAFAEFEVLQALATYAFEHPANTYPEILPAGAPPAFIATALTHPLLPARTAVANNVQLDAGTRFYLISGSNMAGKSTLLRALGTATVLALAGAPVPATRLCLSAFTLCASISVADSLADGKSKFLAEVERLHAILQAAHPFSTRSPNTPDRKSPDRITSGLFTAARDTANAVSNKRLATNPDPTRPDAPFTRSASNSNLPSATRPVLFLVDEIFSGTNSADRLTAATAILRQLIANGALGALSTHDLALTTLAASSADPTAPAPGGRNLHMTSPDPANPLAFDYLLKPGINPSTNALAILRMIGIEP